MEQTDITNTNLPYIKNRFYNSGEICKGMHLVDLYMYDSSLFANTLILEDTDITLIIDMGTSTSVKSIINYINFNKISIQNVLLLPTHHHFDHIGGLPRLVNYLESKLSNFKILSSDEMIEYLIAPKEYQKSAEKGFSDFVGQLSPIKREYIRYYQIGKEYPLGEEWKLSILPTPGHSPDHISPVLENQIGQRVCFFSEALGINLQGAFSPIPATSAPDFSSKEYLESISLIENSNFDLGLFSHVGGIARKDNIKTTCKNARKGYEIFRNDIIQLYGENPSTRYVVEEIFDIYKDFIGTSSINMKVAKNLAFTIVYGVILDEGLKNRQ